MGLVEPCVLSISESNDLEEINDILRALRASQVHLIGPGVQSLLRLGAVPYGHFVSWQCRVFDPTIGGPHFCAADGFGRGHFGLKREALLELWGRAGGREVSSRREDDGRRQHYARHTWVGEVRNLNGAWINQVLSKEVDLRDGLPAIQGMSPDYVIRQRSRIDRLAAHGAQHRVIRSLLGIRPSYDRKMIGWPFVSMKLVFAPPFPNQM
jgi:hypothetical protein